MISDGLLYTKSHLPELEMQCLRKWVSGAMDRVRRAAAFLSDMRAALAATCACIGPSPWIEEEEDEREGGKALE